MNEPSKKQAAIANALAKLTMIPRHPLAEQSTRLALTDLLDRMSETAEQIDWLAEEAINQFDKWPSARELRALYCMRYKPADGREENFSLGHRIMQQAEQQAIEQSDRYKLIEGTAGAAMLRELLPGKFAAMPFVPPPDTKQRDEQTARWYAICQKHRIPKIFPKLSNEFAIAEVERREDILAIVERDIAALTKSGGKL